MRIDVAGSAPDLVDDTRTIRDQAALCDINAVRIDPLAIDSEPPSP
jgi:hypothetical protein